MNVHPKIRAAVATLNHRLNPPKQESPIRPGRSLPIIANGPSDYRQECERLGLHPSRDAIFLTDPHSIRGRSFYPGEVHFTAAVMRQRMDEEAVMNLQLAMRLNRKDFLK